MVGAIAKKFRGKEGSSGEGRSQNHRLRPIATSPDSPCQKLIVNFVVMSGGLAAPSGNVPRRFFASGFFSTYASLAVGAGEARR